jgi:hypothetical protein
MTLLTAKKIEALRKRPGEAGHECAKRPAHLLPE